MSASEVVDGARKRNSRRSRRCASELEGRQAQAGHRRGRRPGRPGPSTASSSPGSTACPATACATSRVAVRDQPGIRAVVLGGAPDGGGAALVAAVAPDAGLHAGELIADAAKLIKGGGGKDPTSPSPAARTPRASTRRWTWSGPRCGSRLRALGIDLGSKRIGVAVSDRGGVLASPLTTVERTGDTPPCNRRLRQLVDDEDGRGRRRRPAAGPRRIDRGGGPVGAEAEAAGAGRRARRCRWRPMMSASPR